MFVGVDVKGVWRTKSLQSEQGWEGILFPNAAAENKGHKCCRSPAAKVNVFDRISGSARS